MFKTRLISEQPIAFHTLSNSLKDGKLAHAYLFVGPSGTPKKETAYLLAQSLVCKNGQDLACEVCHDCQRIISGNYADLIYLDGHQNKIKKEDIIYVQHEFNKTGLETFNKKIYIIDAAENATLEALNSLLKFLEEPSGSNTTAILLTEQSDRILPTIRSRCQIIQFKALSRDFCYNVCVSSNYDPLDAYILANLARNVALIDQLIEDADYQTARQMFKKYIENLPKDDGTALIEIQNDFLRSKDNNRQVVKFFTDICILFFSDMYKFKQCDIEWYNTQLKKIAASRYNNRQILNVLLKTRDQLMSNANVNLLVDQMYYEIWEAANGQH